MIEKRIIIDNDPKYNMKIKLKEYLSNKISIFESNINNNKTKSGRPKSNLSIDMTIDAIFLCSN